MKIKLEIIVMKILIRKCEWRMCVRYRGQAPDGGILLDGDMWECRSLRFERIQKCESNLGGRNVAVWTLYPTQFLYLSVCYVDFWVVVL